jgi:UDP-glucuronate decarboxylase
LLGMSTNMGRNVIAEDLAEIACGLDVAKLRGKKVLVAGAGGFLPAYMVETLLYLNVTQNCGCRVFALVRDVEKASRRFAHYSGCADLVFIQGDISALGKQMDRADLIIHAASPASPKYYGKDPVGVMRANIIGMCNLLELARMWAVDSFLYFSSGEVYGQLPASSLAAKESDYGYIDILDVRACYAESKRASETLGVSYWVQHGVPCKIVRPFHTYGPGMALDDGRVFADFVADVVNRRNIVLRSDGSAIRAFCYLADAVRAFFTVLLSGRSGQAYNVGNPMGALSVLELSELLVGMCPGLQVDRLAGHADAGYLKSPIARNVPNIEMISLLGWMPKYMPKEGFARTIRSFLET